MAWWTSIEKAGRLGNLSNPAEAKHNRLYQFLQLTLNLKFSESLSIDEIGVAMPGRQRWASPVMGRGWPIVSSCHLFLRMRKMCKYTNFKRTSGALWQAGMVCAVTAVAFLSFAVGETLALADHQINGTIFYVLYLPVCNLASDIHWTVFIWKYSQDNITLHVHKHHLTGTLVYMGKVMICYTRGEYITLILPSWM